MRKGSPLTLYNHFIQPYRVLDTLFPEYYLLLLLYIEGDFIILQAML